MSDDVLIRCEDVGKKFCRDLKKSLWYGVKDSAADLFGRRNKVLPAIAVERQLLTVYSASASGKQRTVNSSELRPGEFWANKDVNFVVKRGECLGLIGCNGAGKTTLLKMLNGLIKPNTGQIQIKGRVGALIALGAGFNPILTGRENIVVNASVLGLSRQQIADRIDDIIDFSDLAEFIDTPVRNYSSGMQVRLGFAIATVMDPDILILDEVLAVGDAAFRHKCYHRINRLVKNAAVILVSHSMDYVGAMASSVGLMHHGEMQHFCDVPDGVQAYFERNRSTEIADGDGDNVRAVYAPVKSAECCVTPKVMQYGEMLSIEFSLDLAESLSDAQLFFSVENETFQRVMAWHSAGRGVDLALGKGHQRIRFAIEPVLLHAGKYHWGIFLKRKESIEHLAWFSRAGTFEVRSHIPNLANIPYLPHAQNFEITTLTES